MPRMKPMDAVVRVLEDEGVSVAFGVPGAAILPLYDSLRGSSIRHISVRHEEGGTHSADGWARITGEPGICIGTSGPAGTNMITGLYTALADSIPMICITGQANTDVLHREAFQAVDIVEIARPVCKWAYQVKETAQLPWAFREAFRIAREGRPGPVLIDLPLNVQKGPDLEFSLETDRPLEFAEAGAARQRARARAGAAGGRRAADHRRRRRRDRRERGRRAARAGRDARHPGLPHADGQGRDPRGPPAVGGHGGHPDLASATRTSSSWSPTWCSRSARASATATRATSTVYRGDRTFIHIDIAPQQIGKVFPADLGIVADAKLALGELARRATPRCAAGVDGAAGAAAGDADAAHGLRRRRRSSRRASTSELNEYFDEDTVFVTAIGLYQIWSGQFQRTYKPRHYLCCGQAGPLGWEVPACIGAKLAAPEKQVVGVVGDYSFQFLMEEVAVAVQYRVAVRAGDGQQRLHGPDPPGRAALRHEDRRRPDVGGHARASTTWASCARWAPTACA